MSSNPKKIRLGICMAGAVSAGAYTAGVVDYLIETLERWQQQKDIIRKKINSNIPLTEIEKLIPLHDVVIEALSGASAGGMTATVLAYSFNDKKHLTTRNDELIPENYNQPLQTDSCTKLYDSWINMVDDEKGSTFSKLMDTSDIKEMKNLKSLLNSQPIDDIASRAIPKEINFSNAPAYVSPTLSVLLSVTNLEGIPVDIRFSNVTNGTRNVLRMHSGFLHYQFNSQPLYEIDYPAEVIGKTNMKNIAVAAMATGAFPFGLANRRIVVNNIFFEGFKKQLKANRNLDVNLDVKGGNYVFTAVDGGAINNEPVGTTVKILSAKKALAKVTDDTFNDENYLVLIDPFPSVTNSSSINEFLEPPPYTLLQQAFKIFSAFKNQSAFKQEDLLNGLEMTDKRYLIYPAKRKLYFLACGLVGGFCGFLKKEFRQHDYQLGRKNCQAFLRYYFGEEVSVFEKVTGSSLSDEQKKQWCYDANFSKEENNKVWKMPLVPDMLMLAEVKNEIAVPGYNGITQSEFETASRQIKKRVSKLVDELFPLLKDEVKKKNKLVGWGVSIFGGLIKRKVVNAASGKVEDYLHKTLSPQNIKQTDLVTQYAPLIEEYGSAHKKTKGVHAIIANGGELIISILQEDVGDETKNIASKGDYIVTGITNSKEQWIVKPDKFKERYKHIQDDYYEPNETASIFALQITADNISVFQLEQLQSLVYNPGRPVFIESPWNESQLISLDDYLVCPQNQSEVYRIGRAVFEQTYERVRGI